MRYVWILLCTIKLMSVEHLAHFKVRKTDCLRFQAKPYISLNHLFSRNELYMMIVGVGSRRSLTKDLNRTT